MNAEMIIEKIRDSIENYEVFKELALDIRFRKAEMQFYAWFLKVLGIEVYLFRFADGINENNLRGNNVQINEAYLNLLRKHFKAAAASREFSDTVKDEINAWISEKTKGMIPKTLDKLDDSTIMLIINAMAFEGKWKNEYKEYQINEDGKFTNYAGEIETAKMLSSEEDYYFETENEKGFMKMYEGDKYAFMAILPLDKEISINICTFIP